MNPQTFAAGTTKKTQIVASITPDGHTVLSSIVTDGQGQEFRRNSSCAESGISPTYYTLSGSVVQTSRQKTEDSHIVGSPVYDDQSRIFFSHNSGCSCRGSGVGCECTKTCSC